MKRSEEIEKQAKEFVDNYMQSCVDYRSLGYHQRKALLNVDLYKAEEVYEEAANWADKTMLEKVCEFFKPRLTAFIGREDAKEVIAEFRKAMEGGAE